MINKMVECSQQWQKIPKNDKRSFILNCLLWKKNLIRMIKNYYIQLKTPSVRKEQWRDAVG